MNAFRRFSILLLALVSGFWGASDSFAQKPPNIVLILADDLGYGDLSSYSATDLQTPHIDSLVAAGMRFHSFYANSPRLLADAGGAALRALAGRRRRTCALSARTTATRGATSLRTSGSCPVCSRGRATARPSSGSGI